LVKASGDLPLDLDRWLKGQEGKLIGFFAQAATHHVYGLSSAFAGLGAGFENNCVAAFQHADGFVSGSGGGVGG